MNRDIEKMKFSISRITAEFYDKELETEFYNYEFFNTVKYLERFLLILLPLMIITMIADTFLIQSADRYWTVFVFRCIVFVLVVMFYLKMKFIEPYSAIYHWVAVTEIIIVLLTFFLFYFYDNHNFFTQTLNVSITLVFIYFIPNRFLYTVINSIIICICYFIFVAIVFTDIENMYIVASIIYCISLIIMSSISAYRMNFYKRVQYANKKELYQLSTRDFLTGAYNRLKFDEELCSSIVSAKRKNSHLSIILMDIDDFKLINDKFGHLNGDMALIAISKLIGNSIRKVDILARWGGEEFSILLPEVDKEEAVEVAERLKDKIACFDIPNVGRVTCSFGVASIGLDCDADSLLQRADRMLYMAKENGKNQVAS